MNISSIVFCLFTIQVVINAFSRDFSYGMKFRLGRSAIEASSPTFTDSTFSLERIHNAGFPSAFIAGINKEIYDRPERRRPQYDAPIIVLPGFVTAAECSEIIRVGSELESKGIVADLYLNHRVNKDLSSGNVSSEAQQLIQEQNLSEEELAADSPSGFRSPLPPSVLLSGEPLLPSSPRGHAIFPPSNSIGQRILQLVGCEDRKISFLEDLWINPNKDCIRIRDQTTVHYRPGEGVPPHVDGNHVTILIYLNDMERGTGGRTIFPEAGIASVPTSGTALMYCSRGQRLLHFAERVKVGEKWVCQILIDHKYRRDATSNY